MPRRTSAFLLWSEPLPLTEFDCAIALGIAILEREFEDERLVRFIGLIELILLDDYRTVHLIGSATGTIRIKALDIMRPAHIEQCLTHKLRKRRCLDLDLQLLLDIIALQHIFLLGGLVLCLWCLGGGRRKNDTLQRIERIPELEALCDIYVQEIEREGTATHRDDGTHAVCQIVHRNSRCSGGGCAGGRGRCAILEGADDGVILIGCRIVIEQVCFARSSPGGLIMCQEIDGSKDIGGKRARLAEFRTGIDDG